MKHSRIGTADPVAWLGKRPRHPRQGTRKANGVGKRRAWCARRLPNIVLVIANCAWNTRCARIVAARVLIICQRVYLAVAVCPCGAFETRLGALFLFEFARLTSFAGLSIRSAITCITFALRQSGLQARINVLVDGRIARANSKGERALANLAFGWRG